MHQVSPEIQDTIDIPLLHIADATAEAQIRSKIKKTGLLGKAFTMEQDFYKGRLNRDHGLDVLMPGKADRAFIHNTIFQELCLGIAKPGTRKEYLRIIDTLAEQGAEAVILGCTEIGMLVCEKDTRIKLFDTTAIHTQKAVEYARQR